MSEPAPATARERLEWLRAAGAAAYDPPAFGFVERLLGRAEAFGGRTGARLAERAAVRAEELAIELEGARARAREVTPDDDLAAIAAIDEGNVVVAARRAKNRSLATRLAPPLAPAATDDAEWLARLQEEARTRAVSLNGNARTPRSLSAALYESSRAALGAMLAALHAEAEIPEDAGPYNPLAIAARTLGELSSLAPAYLAALIAQLEEISPLLGLPAPPPERTGPSPAPRRRRPRTKPPGRE